MTTARRLLPILLGLLGALAPGQGAACATGALHLEVGITTFPGGQPILQWTCAGSGETWGRFRITAEEGTWAFLFARVSVAATAPADRPRLAALLATHPWLAPIEEDSGALHASLAGQTKLRMDPAVIQGYAQNCLVPTAPAWPLPSDQVRLWCQPVLDLDGDGPLTVHAFEWDALAAGQSAWQLAAQWGPLLTDPFGPDPHAFSFWSLMEAAVMRQAPTAKAAKAFLQSPVALPEALDLGMTLWVQAFGMRDVDPLLDPTGDPETTPGLPSLDHLPPVDPDFVVSTAIPIPILPGLPLGGDPPDGSGGPYTGAPGSLMPVRLDRRVAPTLIHFPGPGGSLLTRTLDYLRPGVSTALVPALVEAGPLHFTNPYGTTLGTAGSVTFTLPTGGGPGAPGQ